jgi:hypothetical protein
MQGDATYLKREVTVEAARLLARKEPELPEAYGFPTEELVA